MKGICNFSVKNICRLLSLVVLLLKWNFEFFSKNVLPNARFFFNNFLRLFQFPKSWGLYCLIKKILCKKEAFGWGQKPQRDNLCFVKCSSKVTSFPNRGRQFFRLLQLIMCDIEYSKYYLALTHATYWEKAVAAILWEKDTCSLNELSLWHHLVMMTLYVPAKQFYSLQLANKWHHSTRVHPYRGCNHCLDEH